MVFRTRVRRESRSGGAPSLRAAFGVLVKCASAVPRSVQAGGWSPFRDVYGCVVAKWLYAVATRERERESRTLLSRCSQGRRPRFVSFARQPLSTKLTGLETPLPLLDSRYIRRVRSWVPFFESFQRFFLIDSNGRGYTQG